MTLTEEEQQRLDTGELTDVEAFRIILRDAVATLRDAAVGAAVRAILADAMGPGLSGSGAPGADPDGA